MNKLRQRREYEDLFHDIVCKMLPKFKRSNIRPTYQTEGGKAVDNIVVDGGVVATNGFTNGSNFIYITAIFDPDVLEPSVNEDGSVDITRSFEIRFNVYGNQSQEVALIIWSLIRGNQILYDLEAKGIFLENTRGITQMNEIINGEVWERRDFTFRFNENVSIPVPVLDKVVLLEDTMVEVKAREEI